MVMTVAVTATTMGTMIVVTLIRPIVTMVMTAMSMPAMHESVHPEAQDQGKNQR